MTIPQRSKLPDEPRVAPKHRGTFDFVASSHSRRSHCAQDDR